jgi:tetratricopeptide (TPR) repeat protein
VQPDGHVSQGDRRSGLSGPQIWGREIPFRNRHFTGRTRQLAELRERLLAASTAIIGQPVMPLYGLGGVGKTEIAAEYAHRYRDEYSLCWWVRSEQRDLIVNSLLNLGRMMQLRDFRLDERDYSIELVIDALNRGEPYSNWLLIFDNASQAGMVARYIPRGPGHVIITSRDTHWRKALGVEGIEVAAFELAETIEFLRKRVPALTVVTADQADLGCSPAEENKRRLKDATDLANALDNLPVAADHAAAYLVETGATVRSYLELLHTNAHKLFAADVDIPYPRAVATTWTVSRQTISPEADALFKLLAFFAPEPIAEELLLQPGKVTAPTEPLQRALNDPSEFRRAARELARFSLAKINGVRNVIQVHRVVQAVTQGQLLREDAEAAAEFRAVAHSLLAASDPNAPDRDDSEEAYERSRQHIVASGALESSDEYVRRLVINQVRRLYRRGGFTESLNLGEAALAQWQQLFNPDDRQTLALAVEVGSALRRTGGRWAEALKLNEETLKRLKSLFGEEDQTYLVCARSYGIDLAVQGHYAEALDNDLRLLPLYESVFRPEHLDTLQLRNNIAISLRCLGRFEEAMQQDETTLAERVRILGPMDTLTLTSNFAIARDLRRLGRWQEALDLIRHVNEILEERRAPWNQFRLLVAADFGVSLRRMGYHSEAALQGEFALQRYTEVLGEDNRDRLRAATNVVNDRRIVDDLSGAQQLGEQTVEAWARIVGPHHPNAVAACANLAPVLRLRGNPQRACQLDTKALADFKKLFGAEHPSPLVVMTNLATDLAVMGEVHKARELGEESLRLHRKVRGESHPCALATAANLAVDRRGDGDTTGAKELQDETIRRYRDTLGIEHPDTRLAAQSGRLILDIEPMMD